MLKNYFLTAFRYLLKQKGYSIINIIGLTIGLLCSFLIFLFVQGELDYDKFYSENENIYRLCITNQIGGKIDTYCNAPRPTSFKMKELYPEVVETTRAVGLNGLYTHRIDVNYLEKSILSEKAFAVDSTFFSVFQSKATVGDLSTALMQPDGVVITDNFAKKLFGNDDPLGKSLLLDNQIPVFVTAVLEDNPGNTHFEFELLVPWNIAYRRGEENSWYGWHVYHYYLLQPNADIEALEAKFPAFFEEYMKETYDSINGTNTLFLQSLRDIHLHSNYTWEMYPNGNITIVYIFSLIGLFILLIACINYINLATARAIRRSREVGMRKVIGSSRSALIIQFLTESVLLALTSVFLTLLSLELFLPLFNNLTSLQLNLNFNDSLLYVTLLFAVGIIVGLVAGIYPAFFLSSFNPVQVLKGSTTAGNRGARMRKILIVLQFSISIILIISTLIVVKQLHYARNKDLGFQKEGVLAISIKDTLVEQHLDSFRSQLLENPEIVNVASSFNIPGTTFNRFPAQVDNNEGVIERRSCQFMQIDYDFVETMDMKIVEGRNFQRDRDHNWYENVLVNETLVNNMGWEEPLGKRIYAFQDSTGTVTYINVIGVVKDFLPNSIRTNISPIIIYLMPENGNFRYRENRYLFLRIKSTNVTKIIGSIENDWDNFGATSPMKLVYLDEYLNKLYNAEENMMRIFIYFSMIAILIACLGLMGLAAFTAEQRTREIGIRKVLGSKILTIVMLLAKDFLRLIILSNIIAWPVAWYFMNKWLNGYAYRISMPWWIYLASGFLALIIGQVTVCYQTYKAANTNPVEALKHE